MITISLQQKFHLFVVSIDFLVFAAFKKWFPSEKDMKNNSNRKDIALGIDMACLTKSNNLRRHISWGSASKEKIFLDVDVGCQSKINYDRLHRKGVPEHNVLRFDVSMHNPPFVHMS